MSAPVRGGWVRKLTIRPEPSRRADDLTLVRLVVWNGTDVQAHHVERRHLRRTTSIACERVDVLALVDHNLKVCP